MTRAMTPEDRLERLSAVLAGARSMLIIVQNTPDPDAIAAAASRVCSPTSTRWPSSAACMARLTQIP